MTRGEHAVNEKPAAPAGWDGLGGYDGETPIPSTELEEGKEGVTPGGSQCGEAAQRPLLRLPPPFLNSN